MQQVAGVLICDTMGQRMEFGREANLCEKLSHVFRLCRKRTSLCVFGFFGRKKMLILLQRGAAAGSISDNRVKIFKPKSCQIPSREFARCLLESGMRGKRPTTRLLPGHHNFAAIGREHPDSGLVELGKSDAGNASREESNARAAWPRGSKGRAKPVKEKLIVNPRKELIAFGEAQQFEDANPARDGLQAGTLVQTEKASRVFNDMGFREELLEKEVASSASKPGALVRALDARAGVLDQLPIFDARGAGSFTGAAVKALRDVIDELVADSRFLRRLPGKLALKNVEHLVDASAR